MKGIAQQVVFLRELGLSWWVIGKIIYSPRSREEAKLSALKVYGIYETYRRRRVDKLVDGVVISSSRVISDCSRFYTPRQLGQYGVLDVEDLRRERVHLARLLKLEKDEEKRREIYRRINSLKLLELVLFVYYLVGLDRYDRDRMYYTMLYSTARNLVERVELGRDGVKRNRNGIEYLSEEAAAFLYVVYFTVLYNTGLQALLDRVREIIFHLVRGRSYEKKIRKLHRIIQEKYGDIVAKIMLRL